MAPKARVEVEFDEPAIRWKGHGYFDTNGGDEPVAAAFSTWDWSRAELSESCITLYDAVGKDGLRREIAARFSAHGIERLERHRGSHCPVRSGASTADAGAWRSESTEDAGGYALLCALPSGNAALWRDRLRDA